MFALHDRVRRRICIAGFFALAVAFKCLPISRSNANVVLSIFSMAAFGNDCFLPFSLALGVAACVGIGLG